MKKLYLCLYNKTYAQNAAYECIFQNITQHYGQKLIYYLAFPSVNWTLFSDELLFKCFINTNKMFP